MLPSYCAETRDTRWFSPAPIVRFDTRGWPSFLLSGLRQAGVPLG